MEALFGFIDRTIDAELARELAFLAHYDNEKGDRFIFSFEKINLSPFSPEKINLSPFSPDREIDLFIRFCLQNNGPLSAQKSLDHFDFLSDEEIAGMEQAVQTAYSPPF